MLAAFELEKCETCFSVSVVLKSLNKSDVQKNHFSLTMINKALTILAIFALSQIVTCNNGLPQLVGRWVEDESLRTGLNDFLWARGKLRYIETWWEECDSSADFQSINRRYTKESPEGGPYRSEFWVQISITELHWLGGLRSQIFLKSVMPFRRYGHFWILALKWG